MKNKIHIGPVAEAVLATIAVAGVITIALCAPNALQMLKPFFDKKKYSHKRSVERSINSLIRTGLVRRTTNEDGEPTLILTKRGYWETAIRNGLIHNKAKKLDKKWRVVIFDVPSTKNKLRMELTRGMRLYGFHLLQKSVWIYPYDCTDFVKLLRDHLELENNVRYLTVISMDNETEVRKYFKL